MYTERTRELEEHLSRLSADAPEDVKKKLKEALGKACAEASDALKSLLDTTERASIGNLDSARKWRDRCDNARSKINGCFGDAAQGLATGPLSDFWWESARRENSYFETLSRVVTPQLHDDLLVHQDVLNKLLGQLWDKWAYLLAQDKAFEDDQKRAIREVATIAKGVVDDMDNATRRVQEIKAEKAAWILSKVEAFNTRLGNAVGEVLKKLIERILDTELPQEYDAGEMIAALTAHFEREQIKLAAAREQISIYQRLLQAELGSVLVIFNSTKSEVEQYLAKNDLDQAREMLARAKRGLEDWESALDDAQERDAENFVSRVITLLDADWRVTEDLNGKFKDKFRGIFIRPLGSETIEQLADAYLMREALRDVTQHRADEKARDFGRLLEAQPAAAADSFRALEDAVSRVPEEVRELAKMKTTAFRDYVRRKVEEHIRENMPAIKELERMFDPNNLDRECSREMLVRALQ